MEKPDLEHYLSEISPGILHFGSARMALLEVQDGFWSIRRQMEALIGPNLTNSVLQQAGANGGAAFARSFSSVPGGLGESRLFTDCLQAYQTAGFGTFEVLELSWPVGKVIIRAQDTFEAWMMRQHQQTVEGPVCAYTSGVLVGFINVIGQRQDVVCIERQCQALGDACCEFELLPTSEAGEQVVVAFSRDPKLGRQINLLEMLFEHMPMGIAIIDRNLKVVRCNPTWAAFIDQYTPSQAYQVLPGAFLFDLEPGAEETLMPLFERVFRGETIRQDKVRIESGGIDSYWDIVLSPLYEGGEIVGLLNVSIDASKRVQAEQKLQEVNATLEQRVEERTRELATLLEISHNVSSTLDLETLLGIVLDQLKPIVDYSGASLMILEKDMLRILAYRGPIRKEEVDRLRIPLDPSSVNFEIIRSVQPMVIPDIFGDTASAQTFRHTAGENLHSLFGYIRCWMGIPLIVKGRVIGMLSLDHGQPNYYTDSSAALALAFANHAAVAIENARLYEQLHESAVVEERNRLARDLHDAVSQTLFSANLIAESLPKLWDRNPEVGKQKLDELHILTRSALSEMRTLLLELRPSSLVDMDLADLLRHLTNAFAGRSRIQANMVIEGQVDPAIQVKEVIYRVVQESLNNINKHAQASQVSITLKRSESQIELEIADNGHGFDPHNISSDHMGVSIMRERAGMVGAQLKIQSDLDTGTKVQLFWKDGQV